ncbi:MAG: acyl-CoA thioesterase [Actinomycetota bacterium]|nr:acyl-CoA thioesterase [Actinomycetota bacterium]
MRHLYDCPLRWADMDSLGHVNNVVYVDYLQEARVDMMRIHAPGPAAAELAEGVVVVGHELEYVSPLVFSPEPVRIESWVEQVRAASFRLGYEVVAAGPDRRVYLRASSLLAPFSFGDDRPRRIREDERAALAGYAGEPVVERSPCSSVRDLRGSVRTHTYSCRVRWSDIDSYGHVNNVKYVEYYQEARIAFISSLGSGAPGVGTVGGFVVARFDVNYLRPIAFRLEPVQVSTWLTRIGRSSYELQAAVHDEETMFATSRAVLVGFDPAAGRSRPLTEAERDSFESVRVTP